jgi:hypothetical protein
LNIDYSTNTYGVLDYECGVSFGDISIPDSELSKIKRDYGNGRD